MDGEYVKIAEAAIRLGLSVDTIRRRIKRGELDAVQMPARSGSTWYVWLQPPQVMTADEPREQDIDEKRALAAWRRHLGDLVLLVSRLQSENRDLATRVGYLEAELEHARLRVRAAEEELRDTHGHLRYSQVQRPPGTTVTSMAEPGL